MAARVNQTLDAKWREKIKASMLINRLMEHANGNVDMSSTQVRAAEILLRKILPDLSTTELQGDITTRAVVSDEPMTDDDWEKRYGDSVEGKSDG